MSSPKHFDHINTNIRNKGTFKPHILYTLIESVKGFQTNFKHRCSRIQSNKVDVPEMLNLKSLFVLLAVLSNVYTCKVR